MKTNTTRPIHVAWYIAPSVVRARWWHHAAVHTWSRTPGFA